jgi:ArsR family transcriptional regulator, arsenate/arsenite/antimonite-responsive transcriptional repressor
MALNLTFKALSDATRREILRLLSGGDMTAGEIAARFAISKPSISHHLGVLKQAGLVFDERRGQNIVYALNTTVFQEVLGWAMGVMEAGERTTLGEDHDRD